MARFDGSLACTLDFGDSAASAPGDARLAGQGLAIDAAAKTHARGSVPISWAVRPPAGAAIGVAILRRPGCGAGALRLPDKYRALEHRRRQAQMKARRLLAAFD